MTLATSTTSDLDLKALAAKSGDLAAYAYAVHGMEIEPYQLAWAEALDNFNRTVIICPPDTFKSTTVQLWIEKQIGLNPNIRILWLMGSGDQAEMRVMSIGQTISGNHIYRRAFNITPDEDAKWTKSILFVKRDIHSPDPTLMGTGLNGPYQGFHFDVIVLDDVTNQEDVRSPSTMDLQESKLRGVIYDRLAGGVDDDNSSRMVGIMTRWGENDLKRVFEEMGFTIIQMPVIGDYPWGPTISNKRFPIERIDEIRYIKKDPLFNLTYMCDPSAQEGNVIKSIAYWDSTTLPVNPLAMLMAVDPASTTKSSSDPSCIGIAGLDIKNRTLYITDMWTRRVEVPDLKKWIVRYAQQTSGLVAIGLETIGFQISLLQELRRDYRLPVRELPYRSRRNIATSTIGLDKDKYSRAVFVESRFASGRLFIPRRLPLHDGISYEQELRSFPNGRHDDRMDVTSFLCAMADTYSPPDVRVRLRAF